MLAVEGEERRGRMKGDSRKGWKEGNYKAGRENDLTIWRN